MDDAGAEAALLPARRRGLANARVLLAHDAHELGLEGGAGGVGVVGRAVRVGGGARDDRHASGATVARVPARGSGREARAVIGSSREGVPGARARGGEGAGGEEGSGGRHHRVVVRTRIETRRTIGRRSAHEGTHGRGCARATAGRRGRSQLELATKARDARVGRSNSSFLESACRIQIASCRCHSPFSICETH